MFFAATTRTGGDTTQHQDDDFVVSVQTVYNTRAVHNRWDLDMSRTEFREHQRQKRGKSYPAGHLKYVSWEKIK